jgi:hypothetical protein
MTEQSTKQPILWFNASGRVTGVIGVVLCLGALVLCIVDHVDLAVVFGVLLFAVLIHVALLRPRIGTTADRLIYRRMFSDLSIPLAAIGQVRVARYFEVTVRGRRFVSPAVGRTLRKTVFRQQRDPLTVYADLVEDQTHQRIRDARAALPPDADPGEVRRTWAVPEIVVGLVLLVAFLVALVV